jgi:hypothetical protein
VARVLAVVHDGPDDAAYAISDRLLGLFGDRPDLVAWLREQEAAGALDAEMVAAALAQAGTDPAPPA